MQSYFDKIVECAFETLRPDEVCLVNLDGENSDFVRLNHAKVRQAGSVQQSYLDISLVLPRTKQQASMVVTLVHDLTQDEERVGRAIGSLRDLVQHCPEDPYLIVNEQASQSARQEQNNLPDSASVIEELALQARGLDLVGIYCAGRIYRGFASSLGQRHWYETYSFNLDWSCYLKADKAVKANYAGLDWQPGTLEKKIAENRRELELLARPVKQLSPGAYRVYLAPAAMDEIMGILKWGGFSEKAIRTKQSCLARMRDESVRLNPKFTLYENMNSGVAPGFDRKGFQRPERSSIIEDGRLIQGMISARTSQEYGIAGNGAEQDEAPAALEVAAGTLPRVDILQRLDTGILINNLWYLNYSDQNAGRITGMTRFATFWVENGKVVAPLEVMRFDESIYRFWGDNLVDLTVERDLCLSAATYYQRATTSSLLPGAIVEGFTLTL